jgi:UDP-N-acetylglucosamine 4-epimerase
MIKYNELKKHLLSTQYTWLITGVAGFIGSNLLEQLLRLNQRVVGIDNLSTGNLGNISQALADSGIESPNKLFTFVEGDVCDVSKCNELAKGVDKILHQAALGSVPRSIGDPINTSMANIEGHLSMMMAAKENGVGSFVYAASSSTYGDHPGLPKVEDVTGNPLSPYAVTKLVNELYADVFARCYGYGTVGLRYFNVFGKRQDPNGAYAAVIPKWIGSVIDGKDISINGDGASSRDFCYIDNVIQANLLSSFYENNSKAAVFNIAYGESTDLINLRESILAEFRKRDMSTSAIGCHHLPFRDGDIKHSLADIGYATIELGYCPSHSLAEGLSPAIEWYLSNNNSKI